MWIRLEKFLKDALGIAEGLKQCFLVGHNSSLGDRYQAPASGAPRPAFPWAIN